MRHAGLTRQARHALGGSLVVVVAVLLTGGRAALAATCNWTHGTNTNWGTAANWTCDGGGTNHVPIAGDAVTFGPSDGNCVLNTDPPVLGSITILSTYSGTISQDVAHYPTLGAFSQAGGTVSSIAEWNVTGNFTLTGGVFNAPTALYVGGVFSRTAGTFTAGTGVKSVALTSTSSRSHTLNGVTFNHLAITEGMTGYWKLDEAAAATTALDYSGFGNHLTQTSKTAITGATLLFKNTNGITFAKADPLTMGYGTAYFQSVNWTLSAWAKVTDIGGAPGTDACGDGVAGSEGAEIINVNNDYAMRVCAQNSTAGTDIYLRAFMRYGAGSYDECSSTGTFDMDDTNWHHLAATYNGTVLTVYVDGVKTACTLSRTQSFNTASNVAIGAHTNLTSYELGGSVDDVRTYNRALTEAEVMLLYRGAQPGISQSTQTLSTTDSAIDINGDFIISGGTVATGTKNITVGGSWLNNGGLFTGTGTVTIDGTAGGSISSNAQRFGALTVSGTGTWTLLDRLWVDGVLSITTGTLATGNYVIHAGTLSKTAGAGAVFTPGTGTLVLDSSTPRILTVDSALNNLRFEDPTETGLVGYWKFDEFTGTTVRDRSVSDNTGTVNGAGTFSATVPSRITFDNPSSLAFDGTSSYVSLGTTGIPAPNQSQTVAAWIYYTALPGAARTIFENVDGSAQGYRFGFGGAGGNRLQIWDAKTGGAAIVQLDLSNTTTYPLSTWRHVAFSYNSTTGYYRLYLNGVEQLTNNSVTPIAVSTASVRIGNRNTSAEYWSGNIDDVRIYNVALADSEVLALYNGTYPGRGGTTTFSKQANTSASSTSTDSGTVQAVYRAYEDQAGGSVQGFPVVAFNWGDFSYYATFVAYNFASGTSKIYKRGTNGDAGGYFALAANRIFVGGPKWIHDGVPGGSNYLIYAIDDQGTVYKLNDASFTASGGTAVATYRHPHANNAASATSSLVLDGNNVYWTGLEGNGTTSSVFRLPQVAFTPAATTATVTVSDGAVASMAGSNLFFANASKLYRVPVSPTLGSLTPSSWAPGAAVYGRVTVLNNTVYFVNYAGKLFAVSPTDFESYWSYQDTHSATCSSGMNCAAKNVFVNWGQGYVYYGDRDGHVYTIDTSTHLPLSGYPFRPGADTDIIETAPLYRSGVLAVGTTAGKVFFIDQRTVALGSPALISSFNLCTTTVCTSSAVSSISWDFDGGQYMVGTADGKLFYLSEVADPTNMHN